MDLATIIKPDAVYRLNLKHPITGKPIGSVFGIRSFESDEVQQATRKSTDMVLAKRDQRIYASEVEETTLERTAASIAWWDWGDNKLDGEQPEFTHENVCDVLRKYGWIYEQVVTASSTRANFTEGSKV